MKINEHEWKLRINTVFQAAIDGQLSNDVLKCLLKAHIYTDLDGKHDNWLPLYSDSTKNYVRGLVEQGFDRLFSDHLEYCYSLDGVLYSTYKSSTHLHTSSVPTVLDYRTGARYWRGSSTVFDTTYKQQAGGLVRPVMPNAG